MESSSEFLQFKSLHCHYFLQCVRGKGEGQQEETGKVGPAGRRAVRMALDGVTLSCGWQWRRCLAVALELELQGFTDTRTHLHCSTLAPERALTLH